MSYAAAGHLLNSSRLRVELCAYERDGQPDFEQLLRARGFSGSEVLLIRLAWSFYEGPLSEVHRLDAHNYEAFLAALDVQCRGELGGDPDRAGRR